MGTYHMVRQKNKVELRNSYFERSMKVEIIQKQYLVFSHVMTRYSLLPRELAINTLRYMMFQNGCDPS